MCNKFSNGKIPTYNVMIIRITIYIFCEFVNKLYMKKGDFHSHFDSYFAIIDPTGCEI